MDLRHLRYFGVVAEEGHIGRAAARLRLAQPALTRQIRDLEKETGVELLVRSPRGVELTEAGAAFALGVRGVLAEAALGVERARLAQEGLRGRIVLGLGRMTAWLDFAVHAVEVIHRRLPHVDVEIRELEAGPVQWSAVESREVDVAVGLEPPPLPYLCSEGMTDSTLDCALVPAAHPVAALERVRPAELSALPLLWAPFELHPALSAALLDECERLDIRSPHDISQSGPHAIWLAVASGRGWSPVPNVAAAWAPAGVKAVPIDDFSVPLVNAAIWRRDDQRPIVRIVLDTLRSVRDAARGTRTSAPRGLKRALQHLQLDDGFDLPVGLELRHLQALDAVQHEQGVGKAAARLGITASALSRRVRDLEDLTGAVLVERTPHGLTPTAAGEALQPGRVLARSEALVEDLARRRRRAAGRLEMGTIEIASTNPVVLRLLQAYHDVRPDVRITFHEKPPSDLLGDLAAGRLDLALLPMHVGARDTGLERAALTRDTISCALLAAGHPLTARDSVAAADLADLPFLFIDPALEPEYYGRALQALSDAGIRLGAVGSTGGLQTTWNRVADGKGWTLGISRHRSDPPKGLAAVSIDGFSLPWGLDLVWQRSDAHAALTALTALAADLSPDR